MPGEPLDHIWSEVQGSLARLVPPNVYRIWFDHLKPVAFEDSSLYLEAPDHTVEWLRRRFGSTITAAARAVEPLVRSVELLSNTKSRERQTSASAAGPLNPAAPTDAAADTSCSRKVNPANTFDEFVIGSGTQFAHAAALTVAETPAHAYNPLFLHGSPGTGKTHLLQAIANYASAHEPQLDVHYETSEAFASNFRSAVRGGDINAFKARRRSCDILVLDDIHFLRDKKRSIEEFFHTVEQLVESGSQVVLSAELAPCKLTFLGPRLQSRIEAGLVAELDPPDLKTRMAVLKKRAPALADDPQHLGVLEYMATSLTSNVRVLEAALIRIHAYASLTQQPISIELAEHVLANLQDLDRAPRGNQPRVPSVERIQRQTSELLEVAFEDLTSAKRNRQVVYARQVAMYLCRELTPLSLPAISSRFGGRDHTTVMHAHRKIRQRLLTDSDARADIERVRRHLSVSPTP